MSKAWKKTRSALVKEARKFRMFGEASKQLSLDEQEDKCKHKGIRDRMKSAFHTPRKVKEFTVKEAMSQGSKSSS